jgi:hypothetical protein
VIDVRDVACLHVSAIEDYPNAQREIKRSNENMEISTIAEELKLFFPQVCQLNASCLQ